MTQADLFAAGDTSHPAVRLNATVEPCDAPRLSKQHRRILEVLEQSPRTNTYLTYVALRYSARIHELKAAGYDITKERGEGGVFIYTLRKASQ